MHSCCPDVVCAAHEVYEFNWLLRHDYSRPTIAIVLPKVRAEALEAGYGAGVSHSSIYGKSDTSKPDVKAIDINQKLAGQSQERGSIPLLYCCTAPELQGEYRSTHFDMLSLGCVCAMLSTCYGLAGAQLTKVCRHQCSTSHAPCLCSMPCMPVGFLHGTTHVSTCSQIISLLACRASNDRLHM